MKTPAVSVCISVMIALFLGACGGGGGGGTVGTLPATPVVTFPRLSELPQNGVVELDGSALGAPLAVVPVNRAVIAQPPGGASSEISKIRLTMQNGNLVRVELDAPGPNQVFDVARGDTITSTNGFLTLRTADRDILTEFRDPRSSNFEYQTFGSWITGITGGAASAGAGSYGRKTPANNVPTASNARYRGLSYGNATLADGDYYSTVSSVNVSTNFSTVDITSSGTMGVNGRTGISTARPELDFAGTGNVTGAEFTANITGLAITGQADGAFYGPNANEVGGLFRGSGPGTSYLGAFGAR